jgi:hypothetical protein
MNRRRQTLYLGILLLIVAVILIIYRSNPNPGPGATDSLNGRQSSGLTEPITRDVSQLVYTKHARCRMDCRNISKEEVEEILVEGKINHAKSDPRSRPDPKYAFEGITDDDQRVRIIFANSKRGIVVVTCIDLEKEWSCDCN